MWCHIITLRAWCSMFNSVFFPVVDPDLGSSFQPIFGQNFREFIIHQYRSRLFNGKKTNRAISSLELIENMISSLNSSFLVLVWLTPLPWWKSKTFVTSSKSPTFKRSKEKCRNPWRERESILSYQILSKDSCISEEIFKEIICHLILK